MASRLKGHALRCGCGHDRDCHYATTRGHGPVCARKGCRCVRFEADYNAAHKASVAGLPSAADLDAVAEEQQAMEATRA